MARSDWLLIAGALVALVAGLLLNGPICPSGIGGVMVSGCGALQFPVPIAIGAAIAAALVVAVLWRRRKTRRQPDGLDVDGQPP